MAVGAVGAVRCFVLFDGGTRCRFTPRSQLLRATALSAQVADLSAPLNFEADAFGTCSCVGTLTYLEPASGVLAEFVRRREAGSSAPSPPIPQKVHYVYRYEAWSSAPGALLHLRLSPVR